MGIALGTFKAIADEFMSDTFEAFAKTMTIRVADEPVYNTDQTYTDEVGTAIELSLDYSAYDNSLVEVGDFLLFTNASQWTADPQTDSNEVIFDGVAVQILLVEKDADNAAYFLTVRRK